MAFSFKVSEPDRLVTVTCDDTAPAHERVALIDELVDLLVHRPELNIFLDVSHLDNAAEENKECRFCDLFSERRDFFRNAKVAIYAGHKHSYGPKSIFKDFAFVYKFRNFALFDNRLIAAFWVKDIAY